MKPIRLCLGSLCALLAGAAMAQPASVHPGSVGAEGDIEVRLVEIDVRVTDSDGRPVPGLGAEDFELLVDGEEVPIEHFSVVEATSAVGHGPEAATGSQASEFLTPSESGLGVVASRPQHLIVYLDQRFLDGAELASAREQLLDFLRRDVPAGTRVMLASADQELRVLQGFTTEPALVADALQDLEVAEGRGGWRTQFDLAMQEVQRYHDLGAGASSEVTALRGTSLTEAVRLGEEDLADTNRPGVMILNQGENNGRTELVETDPRYSLQVIESFDRSLAAGLEAGTAHLARLVTAAAGLPGETAVLYVGGTLPVNATRTLFEL